MLLMAFMAPWAANAQQTIYSYGFENNNFAGEGWTCLNARYSYTGISTTSANSGTYSYKLYYKGESSKQQIMISPKFDGNNITKVTVSFYYYSKPWDSTHCTFKVGYSTNATVSGDSDFTWIDDWITPASSQTWLSYNKTFEITTGSITYIAIKNDNTDGDYLLFDDFSFVDENAAPSTCTVPTGFINTALTTNSATFTWTETGDFNIRYKTSTTPWDTIAVSTTPYTLPGLAEYTQYEVQLQTNCGEGDLSDWTSSVFVTTKYTPITLPYFEGFENGMGHWTMENCHTSTGISSDANYSGTKGFKFYFRENPPQYLISPEFSGATNGIYVSFYYKNSSSSYPETFQVGYSTTTNATSAFIWDEEQTAGDTQWHLYEHTFLYDVKYIAVKLNSNDKHYLYIDDFNFKAVKVFNTAGNWNVASNWASNSIPTIGDNAIINFACTIPSGTVAQANNIEIASGASLTIADSAQLICNSFVYATTKKTITAATNWGEGNYTPDGWYFIASPIDNGANGTNVGDVALLTSGDYDLYRFNQAGANGEWENYKAHQNDTINPFKLYNKYGYLYANKNTVTLEFTGYTKPALSSGLDSLLLVYDNEAAENMKGWNLVGNPYVFNAYANKPYYKINEEKDGLELVSAYNTNPIAPCTGVLVQATGARQYVKFTKNAPAAPSKGNVELNLTGNGKRGAETLDKAIVSFNEDFELGKFYFGQQNANIYIPQNGEEYAIISSEAQGEMPVNFKANADGQYTISVNVEDVEMGYLHLIDNMTGADIDLLSTPSYTFNASTTDYASRFRIVFAGNSVNEFDTEDNFAFISNGQVIVNNEGFATLQVIDITGRIISSEIINGSCSTNLNAATGVYVLRLINGENVKTQKIVVK